MHTRRGTAAALPAVMAVAVAVLMSACSDTRDEVQVAKAAFCEDLASFRASVDNISVNASQAAPGTVAVDDVRTARDSVSNAFGEVRSSASQLEEALLANLQSAYDDLNGAVENLDGDTTLQEAQTELAARKGEFLTAWEQVAGLADCPAS